MNAQPIISHRVAYANYTNLVRLPGQKNMLLSSNTPSARTVITPVHYDNSYDKFVEEIKNVEKKGKKIDFIETRKTWIKEEGLPTSASSFIQQNISEPLNILSMFRTRDDIDVYHGNRLAEIKPVKPLPPPNVSGASASSSASTSSTENDDIVDLTPQQNKVSSKEEADDMIEMQSEQRQTEQRQPEQRQTANSKEEADDPEQTTDALMEFVFSRVKDLSWTDKDDGVITYLRRLPAGLYKQLFDGIMILANDLRRAVNEQSGLFNDMEEETALNILFHAVAKGYEFYMQALVDAEFIPYLCEQYQPLYTMLKKKIKYIDSQIYNANSSRSQTENIDIF